MLHEERNQPNEVLGCHKILQACSHFTSFENLDRRAHYMTIHLRREDRQRGIEGWRRGIEDVVYRKICQTLTRQGLIPDHVTPGLLLDQDRADSRYGQITNENPHLHGLLFTPRELGFGDRLRLNWAVDECLRELGDVTSSETTIYIQNKPLGMVADYNAKLAKLKSLQGIVDELTGKIYPIDRVRTDGRFDSAKHITWRERADRLIAAFYRDPDHFFSTEYCHKFRSSLSMLSDYGKKQSLVRDIAAHAANIDPSKELHCPPKLDSGRVASETVRRCVKDGPAKSQGQLNGTGSQSDNIGRRVVVSFATFKQAAKYRVEPHSRASAA